MAVDRPVRRPRIVGDARSASDAPSAVAKDGPRIVVGQVPPSIGHMSSRDPCSGPGTPKEKRALGR